MLVSPLSLGWSFQSKTSTLPGGFEPPTFRLTAERAAECATEADDSYASQNFIARLSELQWVSILLHGFH